MRKYIAVIFSLLGSVSLVAQAETLKVGYFDLPPHTFPQSSTQPSAALEYFDKVAQAMGVDVEYIHYPLSRLVFLLDHQRLDAALFLAKTDARTHMFSYPSAPYFTTESVFVVPKESELKSEEDIKQTNILNIVVWEGGFHSPTLAASKNKLIPLSGNDIASRGVILVVNGRFDAFYSPDRYAVEYEAKRNGHTDSIRLLPISQDKIDIYTVFSKSSGKLYLKRYERALKKVHEETDYKTFFNDLQKNLPQPVADSPATETNSSVSQ